MGALAAGQLIIVPFPFSDLRAQKYRPALILADAGRGDWIRCQISCNPFSDSQAIELDNNAFSNGSLSCVSYAHREKFSPPMTVRLLCRSANCTLQLFIRYAMPLWQCCAGRLYYAFKH